MGTTVQNVFTQNNIIVNEIYEILREYSIGIATIYRALNLFTELGRVKEININISCLNLKQKVAIALTEDKAISIEGGNYRAKFCKFKCFECDSIYEINYAQDKEKCSYCGSEKVLCSKKANICTK